MAVKILHSADWHLDSPFASQPEDRRQFLQAKLREIPERIAEMVRQEQCDLVLLAGDLFDGPAAPETLQRTKEALAECRVPVFVAPGNHDYITPDSPWLREMWPDNVHIFTGDPEYADIPELECRVYGAGYRSMDCPPLLDGFRAADAPRWRIGLLHGDAVQPNSPYCPVTAAQVRGSNLDYLALGHIHKLGAFRAGATLCAWPGCPMGRGWDETGEKGVIIVTLDETVEIRAESLDALRFYDLETDITDGADSALESVLPAAASEDFYRVTLTGAGEPNLAQIAEKFAYLPHLELRDRSEIPVDLWADAGEDSLRGVYFRMLQELALGDDPEQAASAQLAARISHALLEGREVKLP